MAYKNLINIDCASKAEFFCRLRDFVCKRNGTYDYSAVGIGWTLHDSSYAVDEDNPQLNDWFVIYSPGEGGNEDMYYEFVWENNLIAVEGWLYWNNSTHAGVSPRYGNGNYELDWDVDETGAYYILYIYGDLNQVFCLHDASSTYTYPLGFGKNSAKNRSEDIALCSGSPSSGSDVLIEVDAIPDDWAVGKAIFIRDNAHIEKIEIKTLSGTTITADLTYSYTTPKLSRFVGWTLCGGSGLSNTNSIIGNDGSTPGVYIMSYSILEFGNINTALDPEPMDSEYGLYEIYSISSSVGMNGVLRHIRDVAGHSSLTNLDIMELDDGTEYRLFKKSGTVSVAFPEV